MKPIFNSHYFLQRNGYRPSGKGHYVFELSPLRCIVHQGSYAEGKRRAIRYANQVNAMVVFVK